MIRDEWGMLPVFLDTRYLLSGGVPSPSSLGLVFEIARKMNLISVPVTSIRLAPAYQQQIRDIIATDKRGVMIRILPEDLNDPALLRQAITALLQVLAVTPADTDILMDLRHRKEQVTVHAVGFLAISSLPSLNNWRTLTLASGCFPKSISDMEHGKWYAVSRSDWLGRSQIVSQQRNNGSRIPAYGDYGIRHGDVPKDVPVIPDPNIRYSDKLKVLVRREKKDTWQDESYMWQFDSTV